MPGGSTMMYALNVRSMPLEESFELLRPYSISIFLFYLFFVLEFEMWAPSFLSSYHAWCLLPCLSAMIEIQHFGTVSPDKLFFLLVVCVTVLYHSNRIRTNSSLVVLLTEGHISNTYQFPISALKQFQKKSICHYQLFNLADKSRKKIYRQWI